MKELKKYILLVLSVTIVCLAFFSCDKEVPILSSTTCNLSFPDSSASHPKAAIFQGIIDNYTAKGLPGIVLLIRDSNGLWVGGSGKADIGNNIDMQPCTVSKVASITKMFYGYPGDDVGGRRCPKFK